MSKRKTVGTRKLGDMSPGEQDQFMTALGSIVDSLLPGDTAFLTLAFEVGTKSAYYVTNAEHGALVKGLRECLERLEEQGESK